MQSETQAETQAEVQAEVQTQAEGQAEVQAEVHAETEVEAEVQADGAARPSSHKAQGSEVYLAAHRPALERALLLAARPHVEPRPRVGPL